MYTHSYAASPWDRWHWRHRWNPSDYDLKLQGERIWKQGSANKSRSISSYHVVFSWKRGLNCFCKKKRHGDFESFLFCSYRSAKIHVHCWLDCILNHQIIVYHTSKARKSWNLQRIKWDDFRPFEPPFGVTRPEACFSSLSARSLHETPNRRKSGCEKGPPTLFPVRIVVAPCRGFQLWNITGWSMWIFGG